MFTRGSTKKLHRWQKTALLIVFLMLVIFSTVSNFTIFSIRSVTTIDKELKQPPSLLKTKDATEYENGRKPKPNQKKEPVLKTNSETAKGTDNNGISWYNILAFGDVLKSGLFPNYSETEPELTTEVDKNARKKENEQLFPHSTKNMFNEKNKFLIGHFDFCRSLQLSPEKKLVLALIPSEPKSSLRRQIIRNSWLPWTRNLTQTYIIEHLFVLGQVNSFGGNGPDPDKQKSAELTSDLIKMENSLHNDIIVGDFVEDYWNLTLKTTFAITWANFFCPQANFVFKIDDDVFVQPYKFVELLKKLPTRNFFGGNCIIKGKPHRNKKSKWYISKEEFPRVSYPPFCYGPAYMFSGDMIPYLFNATLAVNFFKLEDVYMGLCIEHAGKTVTTVNGVSNLSPKYSYCLYKDLALAHGIEPSKWSMYYRDIAKRAPQNIVCPKKGIKRDAQKKRGIS